MFQIAADGCLRLQAALSLHVVWGFRVWAAKSSLEKPLIINLRSAARLVSHSPNDDRFMASTCWTSADDTRIAHVGAVATANRR
jgi:hypothetical protein